jgi:hypothetical protein
MLKDNGQLLTDEFLDELVKQINEQYGFQTNEEEKESNGTENIKD